MKWFKGFGKPEAGVQEPHDNFVAPPALAVEIDGDDIKLIERLENSMSTHDRAYLGQFSARALHGSLAKRLYKRVGAARPQATFVACRCCSRRSSTRLSTWSSARTRPAMTSGSS